MIWTLFILLLVQPLYAETLSFPEPMVFDLVRGLDNKKGELEVNALTFSSDAKKYAVSPEIEYSVMEGLAFEIEIPMQNQKVEAIKYSGQYTFYRKGEDILFGVQGIFEDETTAPRKDTSLIGIMDYRFSAEWAAVVMLGERTAFITHKPHHGVMIMNASVFFQASRHFFVGLENDKSFYFIDNGAKITTIPQISWRTNEHVRIQAGVGVDWKNHCEVTSYLRLVAEGP